MRDSHPHPPHSTPHPHGINDSLENLSLDELRQIELAFLDLSRSSTGIMRPVMSAMYLYVYEFRRMIEIGAIANAHSGQSDDADKT